MCDLLLVTCLGGVLVWLWFSILIVLVSAVYIDVVCGGGLADGCGVFMIVLAVAFAIGSVVCV